MDILDISSFAIFSPSSSQLKKSFLKKLFFKIGQVSVICLFKAQLLLFIKWQISLEYSILGIQTLWLQETAPSQGLIIL